MRAVTLASCLAVIAAFTHLHAQQPDAPKAQKKVDVVRGPNPVDVLHMARPIEMHDSVWIQELTALEVRDLIKEGKKKTALILGGGMEENGPYLVLDKHNLASRVMGESIARKLGNALCAPILTIEPGRVEHPTPGAIVVSAATYREVVTDMATSLQAMGFKNIVFLGDHGGDMKPMAEAAETLNEKWKGTGAKAIFIEKYGNNVPDEGCCGHPGEDVVGVHEKIEGLHDSYMMSAMIMTLDLNSVRLPERIKAGKTTTNAIDLLPVEKTIADGKKLIDFRAEETANEIRKRAATDAGTP
jgi:creatinine amidohydrolase/Fe(II)-dependent formamide hydrolase-like protein